MVNYGDFLVIKASNRFVSMHGDYFKKFDNHSYNHTKKIIECYLTIQLKSHARLYNEGVKKKRVRSKFNKIVLFSRQ